MSIKPSFALASEKKRLLNYLREAGILRTPAVIRAFEFVPREKFVPHDIMKYSYVNEPLPIGHGQTISQPQTVAVMTEALDLKKGMNVLEIGTGSGYQAAIISKIIGPKGKLTTVERIADLVEMAKRNLASIGIRNIEVIEGDGTLGYEKNSPYDRIIVTAETPDIPQPLLEQLKKNGKMVIPMQQQLWIIVKDSNDRIRREPLGFYVFVPLIGKHGFNLRE